MAWIGTPIDRVDGIAKVTGGARYAGEFDAPDLAYGYVVSSRIAKGRIERIDTDAALAVPGVLQVFTHANRPPMAEDDDSYQDEDSPDGAPFRPLWDDRIHYNCQPIALVVAEDFETARYAASLVRADFAAEAHQTDILAAADQAFVPRKPSNKPRAFGDVGPALEDAALTLSAGYGHAIEHHNPIEMHASTAVWEGDGRLTLYDKTQGVLNSRNYICSVLDLPKDEVRVVSPFVGGAFGSGLRPQYQLVLAVMAARALRRSVRVTLTREQMYSFGYRPATRQAITLGADADGTLAAIQHSAIGNCSRYEQYKETVADWSPMLYRCANVRLDHKLVALDLPSPMDMRAPGAAIGVNAFECAMDELAHLAGIDPVELRLKNYSDLDPLEDKPYSSKELRACYAEGARRFGWDRRSPEPRSMREGNQLIGWGMASGIWEALMMKTSAKGTLLADGRLEVGSATADIGTGTYTVMTQVAAETMGLPIDHVTAKLGDTDLPEAPIEGGSWGAASTGSAVKAACEALREKLFERARGLDGSPLANAALDQVTFADGRIALAADPSRSIGYADVLRQSGIERLEADADADRDEDSKKRYAHNCHSAVFAEVRVDEELNVVRVTRLVNAVAAGRIINPKTARSQVMGGMVFGMGMALHEETLIDHRLGRILNRNIADYHVPANADVHEIDVIFVEEHDERVNPLGVKGVGEIGIVGTAAAIANAVFHATGKRVREYPITIEKLLA